MPPRCVALCSRAGWRAGPTASLDNIWITDMMLRQAIERFQRVSGKPYRTISSVPGPMESRRRLNKRHMTAVMSDSRSAPSPWAIELPLRPDEGKWEAPTESGNRNLSDNKSSVSRLLDRLIGWLENPDQDASTDISITSTAQPHAAETTMAPSLQQSLTALRQRLAALNLAALDLASRDDEITLWEACRPFSYHIRHSIQENTITSEDLIIALDPFDSQTKNQLVPELLDVMRGRLATQVVRTIYVTREHKRYDRYTDEFWSACVGLLKEMSRKQFETYFYFMRLAQSMPRKRHRLNKSLVFNMLASYVEFQASLPFPHKHSTSHNVIFGAATKYLARERPELMWMAALEILGEKHSGVFLTRLQRQAVMTMSFSPDMTSRECFDMYPGQWTSEDAFFFTKGRLWATRCLQRTSVPDFMHLDVVSQDWVGMVKDIWSTPETERKILLQQLCRSTIKTGQFRTMAEQLVEKMSWNTKLFREIAIASGNYRKARLLWRLVRDKVGIEYIVRCWDWTAWTPYVEAMIKDPDINIKFIWRVLGFNWGRPNKAQPGTALCGINSQTELLELMARWFLEADCLSDRQTLHWIEECLRVYQSIDKNLSPQMILCMVEVILRDLERGNRGRQERLAWMVRLIKEHMGDEEADKVLHQLQGWRWTIENRAPCPEKEEERPTIQQIEVELAVLAQDAARGDLKDKRLAMYKEPENILEHDPEAIMRRWRKTSRVTSHVE
ncbi:hypothetical protein B0J13DRAFT_538210 [Dactylonectria estremocensis]|uniref:Uncharacterized protein n=1 Tax=Dactylonectria estremocensis TaxID=1079267 RepID=A0A9P9FKR5_9HYPO|nr:hypothetical protein B0J13DRAFT_538210 [Dactylonectria estremocensis]